MQRRSYSGKEVEDTAVTGEMTALVRSGAKYIFAPEENRREFYQLPSDPHEAHNLLAQAAAGQDAALGEAPAAGQPPVEKASADGGQSPLAAEAKRHDEELAAWRRSHPEPQTAGAPVDKEDVKALRSLGYVD